MEPIFAGGGSLYRLLELPYTVLNIGVDHAQCESMYKYSADVRAYSLQARVQTTVANLISSVLQLSQIH